MESNNCFLNDPLHVSPDTMAPPPTPHKFQRKHMEDIYNTAHRVLEVIMKQSGSHTPDHFQDRNCNETDGRKTALESKI